MIPFNKPYLVGREVHYMYQAVYTGTLYGNELFTKRCQQHFGEKYGIKKTLLTISCMGALEKCTSLCGVGIDNELRHIECSEERRLAV